MYILNSIPQNSPVITEEFRDSERSKAFERMQELISEQLYSIKNRMLPKFVAFDLSHDSNNYEDDGLIATFYVYGRFTMCDHYKL